MKLRFIIIFLSLTSLFKISADNVDSYKLFLKVFPTKYDLYIGEIVNEPSSISNNIRTYLIPKNTRMLFLRSIGYRDKYLFLPVINIPDPSLKPNSQSPLFEMKLEKLKTSLKYMDMIHTGSQPKSVEFSPDGRYMAVALLNGGGVEIYSLEDLKFYQSLKPPLKWSKKKGFVETVFFKTRDELWVSQMTTGLIHVFNTKNWEYKCSFNSGGSWPKVITLNRNEDTAFISNWESRNISIINTENYRVEKTISVNGSPRGMAVSPNQKFLYVANFSSGDINKINIENQKFMNNIDLGNGALRHMAISENSNQLYISDMFYGKIYILNIRTDKVDKSFYAGSNINTIKLSSNERFLYISSRGHNHKNGYLQKGPDFGKILVYDTTLKKITDWTWGGNQPTGLAVSPDDSLVVFSDFLDHRIELYHVIP